MHMIYILTYLYILLTPIRPPGFWFSSTFCAKSLSLLIKWHFANFLSSWRFWNHISCILRNLIFEILRVASLESFLRFVFLGVFFHQNFESIKGKIIFLFRFDHQILPLNKDYTYRVLCNHTPNFEGTS
jgi:hypothetical protein